MGMDSLNGHEAGNGGNCQGRPLQPRKHVLHASPVERPGERSAELSRGQEGLLHQPEARTMDTARCRDLVSGRRRSMGSEKPPHSRDEVAGSHREPGSERQTTAADSEATGAQSEKLMEKMLHPDNLLIALKRVRSNKGAPGIDGMTVDQLGDYLDREWPAIRKRLRRFGLREIWPAKPRTTAEVPGGMPPVAT